METTTTCIIKASDFSPRSTDPNHDTWTAGKMRHVSAALAGTPCAIVADRQTGHTLVGVTLGSIRPGGGGEHARVAITSTFSDGSGQTLHHLLFLIGSPIIPLGGGDHRNAKWRALRTYSDERIAAVTRAQREHDPKGDWWGTWEATPDAAGVTVSYRPSTGNEALRDRWGTHQSWVYSLDQLGMKEVVR